MDYLVHLRNRVPERQRAYQSDIRPLYLRSPRSRVYLGLWYTGFAVGLTGVLVGAAQLIIGKPKEG